MDSLVSTAWLAERIGESDLRVIDASMHLAAAARDAGAEFAAAHIPGARFLDLASLRDTGSAPPNTLPTAELAARRLGALDLAPSSRIVLYDDSALRTSARAWFVLRGFGLQRIAILDGGLAKWRSEGRSMESGAPGSAPDNHAPRPFAGAVRDKAAMLVNVATGTEQVLDARDPGRFAGDIADAVHGLPGGHIPGSRNLHYRDLFEADGTFKPPPALRAALAEAGVDPARPVIATCGSGVTAAVLLFALHVLGAQETALYDGSWSEWGADPATPKATGPA